MQNRRNYYRILHVQPGAPAELIRASYRTLMQQLKMHPDLGGDHQQAVLINEAFATLSDPLKRADYDRRLVDSQKGRREARDAKASAAARPEREAASPDSCAFCGAPHAPQAASDPAALCWRCESPLCHAVKQSRDKESRGLDRTPRQIAADVRTAGRDPLTFRSTTEDISISGASFVSAVALRPGQRLRLDCAFCVAVGVVRHVHHEPAGRKPQWRIGVEFLTLLIKRPRGSFVSTQA